MDGLAELIKMLQKCRSLFAVMVIIFLVLLFEQYTDYFRLLRLEKISNIEANSRYERNEISIQIQIRKELNSIILPRKVDSLGARVLAACAPWIILCIWLLSAKWNRNSGVIPDIIALLAIGASPVLLPDFFPTWKMCLIVSCITLFILAYDSFSNLVNPDRPKVHWDREE